MGQEPTVVTTHEAHPIHLPLPSFWPIVMALGIALALAGIAWHPAVWIVGLVIVAIALGGWFREMGEDLREAPDEPD